MKDGRAGQAIIPIENSQHGRVADIHFLLPESGLFITGEYFMPIHHALMALGENTPGRRFEAAYSHPQALGQCSLWLQEHLPAALQLPTSSTAEAARLVKGSRFRAAIASVPAGREHGLPVRA